MGKNHYHWQHKARRNKHAQLWLERTPRVPKPQMARVEVVAMNRLRPGVVVWGHIPFADGDGEKTRPAVVITTSGSDVELLPVTTKPGWYRTNGHHIEIRNGIAAGLDRNSSVRLRPVVVDRLEVLNVVGQLTTSDLAAVLARLDRVTAS